MMPLVTSTWSPAYIGTNIELQLVNQFKKNLFSIALSLKMPVFVMITDIPDWLFYWAFFNVSIISFTEHYLTTWNGFHVLVTKFALHVAVPVLSRIYIPIDRLPGLLSKQLMPSYLVVVARPVFIYNCLAVFEWFCLTVSAFLSTTSFAPYPYQLSNWKWLYKRLSSEDFRLVTKVLIWFYNLPSKSPLLFYLKHKCSTGCGNTLLSVEVYAIQKFLHIQNGGFYFKSERSGRHFQL